MKITLEIAEDSLDFLVPALVEAATRKGLLISKAESDDPLTLGVAAQRAKLSKQTISRLVEDGVLDRVKGTGRILIVASSFNRWREGNP